MSSNEQQHDKGLIIESLILKIGADLRHMRNDRGQILPEVIRVWGRCTTSVGRGAAGNSWACDPEDIAERVRTELEMAYQAGVDGALKDIAARLPSVFADTMIAVQAYLFQDQGSPSSILEQFESRMDKVYDLIKKEASFNNDTDDTPAGS